MQRIVLKDITCLSDASFCNESEHQAKENVEKCIRQFNKETLKNERQARKEGKELMMLFVSKKRLLSYNHYELYSFNEDTNVLQFPHQGVGWKDFLVEIRRKKCNETINSFLKHMSKKITLIEVNKCIENTLLREHDLWFDKRKPRFIDFGYPSEDSTEILFSEDTFLWTEDYDDKSYYMDVAIGAPYGVEWCKRIYGSGSYAIQRTFKVNYDVISYRDEPISDMLKKAIKDAYGSMTAPKEQSAQAVADWLIGYMKLDDVPEKYFHLI